MLKSKLSVVVLVKQELRARNWSHAQLADAMGANAKTEGMAHWDVYNFLDGKKEMSELIAHGLAQAFGTSPDLWLNIDRAIQAEGAIDVGQAA